MCGPMNLWIINLHRKESYKGIGVRKTSNSLRNILYVGFCFTFSLLWQDAITRHDYYEVSVVVSNFKICPFMIYVDVKIYIITLSWIIVLLFKGLFTESPNEFTYLPNNSRVRSDQLYCIVIGLKRFIYAFYRTPLSSIGVEIWIGNDVAFLWPSGQIKKS